tara:strand:+ start:2285 stop:2923 length:639 start_codon:yes stop_codon:yes gene_type:complete
MDFYTPTGLHVYMQTPVDGVDVESVIHKIENKLPHHFLSEIEMIVFGWFDEFEERSINAFYKDNAIYVSHMQQDEEDLYDDLVHEISHSLEEAHGYQIYADEKVKKEFLRKRKYLHDILWQAGYRAPLSFFQDVEFNEEFDNFLYKKIGYDKLASIMSGLFISPYAATSLREYFATGFTEYYMDSNHNFLQKISPAVFEKINLLQDIEKLDF